MKKRPLATRRAARRPAARPGVKVPRPKQAFTLRFALRGPEPEPLYEDARLEALRCQLAALLDIVVLTHAGEPACVDGFKLVSELKTAPEKVYRLFPPGRRDQSPVE